jgi:hypothetical protein
MLADYVDPARGKGAEGRFPAKTFLVFCGQPSAFVSWYVNGK